MSEINSRKSANVTPWTLRLHERLLRRSWAKRDREQAIRDSYYQHGFEHGTVRARDLLTAEIERDRARDRARAREIQNGA